VKETSASVCAGIEKSERCRATMYCRCNESDSGIWYAVCSTCWLFRSRPTFHSIDHLKFFNIEALSVFCCRIGVIEICKLLY
jgi:hypothetical protein